MPFTVKYFLRRGHQLESDVISQNRVTWKIKIIFLKNEQGLDGEQKHLLEISITKRNNHAVYSIRTES